MSTPDPIVYRTSDRYVLERFRLAKIEYKAWHDACVDFAKSVHPDTNPMMQEGFGSKTLAGIKKVTPIPDGWRELKQGGWPQGVLVPYRSKKEGKAWAKQMDALRTAPDIRSLALGDTMPAGELNGFAYIAPGMDELDGALYVRWSDPPRGTIDESVWERVPLSRYYEVKEAHDPEEVNA